MSSSLTNLTHKQLFLTDCKIKNTEILIENKDLLSQVRKVLRLQKGDAIYVQHNGTRYEVEIKDWDDKTLKGTIKGSRIAERGTGHFGMIIGMPNKWEKVELIVQKLTEIGLDEIIFWPSERSVIKTWNTNKEERLLKIAREAVEQSWGRTMPTVTFVTNLKEKLQNCKMIVFDKMQTVTLSESKGMDVSYSSLRSEGQETSFGLVGPEGGLTERDYEVLKGVKYEIRELGDTMMRTETAAIVGGWIIKNSQEKFA